MAELIAHVECMACRHQARIPVDSIGSRRGPALWRVLRCSKCGSLGKAELRLMWVQDGNPLAAGDGAKPREQAS
jgi:hypothetical protein